jgi:hypothetical protein
MANPGQPRAAEIVTRLRGGENPIDVARQFHLSLVNLADIAQENGLILNAERSHAVSPAGIEQPPVANGATSRDITIGKRRTVFTTSTLRISDRA